MGRAFHSRSRRARARMRKGPLAEDSITTRVSSRSRARAQSAKSGWSGRRVSNSRPQAWEAGALPTELLPLMGRILKHFRKLFITVVQAVEREARCKSETGDRRLRGAGHARAQMPGIRHG